MVIGPNEILDCDDMNLAHLVQAITNLKAENAKLRHALEAYANEANWAQGGSDGGNLWTGAEVKAEEGIWGTDIAKKALNRAGL